MPNLAVFVVSGVGTGAVYVLSAVGMVVLFRASGVLNFAQGAVGAVGALVAWSIADAGGADWLSWFAGIAVSVGVSLLYGRLLAPRLSHRDPVVRAVATLGFALLLLGLAEFLWGETPRSLRLPTDTLGFYLLGVRVTYTRVIAVVFSFGVTAGIIFFLGHSRLGLAMRALAANRDLSGLLGIPVLTVDAWAWALSGALAGISGLMLANLVRLQAQSLTFMVIPTIAAAIVGRLQSLPATIAGGLVIGIVEALCTPFPVIAPFRAATPFVVAALALLWLQRSGSPASGAPHA